MVVLGGDEDEPVEPADRRRPRPGVRVLVLAHVRWRGLVEVWEWVVDEVDELELGVGPLPSPVHDPVGDLFSSPAGSGAAQDDGDTCHDSSLVSCQGWTW